MKNSNDNRFRDDEPLAGKQEGGDQPLKDAKYSDAASDNERDMERVNEAGRASTPSYLLDSDDPDDLVANRLKPERNDQPERDRPSTHPQASAASHSGASANNFETEQPLTTEGSGEEKLEMLAGTTNLSLEQLKKEGGPSTRQPAEADLETPEGSAAPGPSDRSRDEANAPSGTDTDSAGQRKEPLLNDDLLLFGVFFLALFVFLLGGSGKK